jgi:hypothetical protein
MKNLSFILLIILTFSFCSKNEDIEKDDLQIEKNTIDSIQSFGGDRRVKFRVWLNNPDIYKLYVLWNNRKDSIVVFAPSSGTPDYLEVIIEDKNNTLADKNNLFILYTSDKDGRKSTEHWTQSRVYGNQYKSSLTNRRIKETVKTGKNELTITFWNSNKSDELGVEIYYINILGKAETNFILSEELTNPVILEEITIDGSFKYRTVFKPEAEALDIFYSEIEPLHIQDYSYLDFEEATTKDEFVQGVKNGSLYDNFRLHEYYLFIYANGILPSIDENRFSKGNRSVKSTIENNTTGTYSRSELKVVNQFKFNEERCFAFDLYIDDTFRAGNPGNSGGWIIFSQFWQDARTMPPISLEIEKGSTANLRYHVVIKNDDTGPVASEPHEEGIRFSNYIDRNRWTRFAIRLKASPEGGSLFELFQNGEKVFTGAIDKIAYSLPYDQRLEWRVGLYRSGNVYGVHTIWYDEIRYGKTLEEVDHLRKP